MSVTQDVPRSPTTGEPVTVVARRNRLGIWLCIVSDITGVVALLVAYSYLWSLNVNNAWAPPNNAFADPLPFWLITVGGILVALLLWWGVMGLKAGHAGRMKAAAALAVIVSLVTFVGQIVQLSTFPFGPGDGAYASATFWLCIGAAFHLSLVFTLAVGVLGRSAKGLISPANPSHARFVAMYSTWAAIAIFLGALFATTMTTSPNTSSPVMGGFQNAATMQSASAAAASAASAVASAKAEASASSAPSAAPSATPSPSGS